MGLLSKHKLRTKELHAQQEVEVVRLRAQKMPFRQIAEALGISVAAASRAMRRVEKRVAERRGDADAPPLPRQMAPPDELMTEFERNVQTLYRMHMTQAEIGRALNCAQSTVHYALARIRKRDEEWAEQSVEAVKAKELADLDEMEHNAARLFRAELDAAAGAVEAARRRDPRSAPPPPEVSTKWYYARLEAKRRRHEIMGLNAPLKVARTTASGEDVDNAAGPYDDTDPSGLLNRLLALLDAAGAKRIAGNTGGADGGGDGTGPAAGHGTVVAPAAWAADGGAE